MSSSQMPELAYWLYKAWQLAPGETALRERTRTYLTAFDRYFYDRQRDAFMPGLALDGKRLSNRPMRVWNIGYGESGPFKIGRVAAYSARGGKEPAFLDLARRAAGIARLTPTPDNVSQECLASALNPRRSVSGASPSAGGRRVGCVGRGSRVEWLRGCGRWPRRSRTRLRLHRWKRIRPFIEQYDPGCHDSLPRVAAEFRGFRHGLLASVWES